MNQFKKLIIKPFVNLFQSQYVFYLIILVQLIDVLSKLKQRVIRFFNRYCTFKCKIVSISVYSSFKGLCIPSRVSLHDCDYVGTCFNCTLYMTSLFVRFKSLLGYFNASIETFFCTLLRRVNLCIVGRKYLKPNTYSGKKFMNIICFYV